MPTDPTPWLTTMASLDGTAWDPSDGHPNPTIQGWLRDIAAAYPNMAGYCNAVINDNYFAWCGVTIAYCMTKANIAPVFGSTDVNRFLFATSWLGWGTPVETPVPGDVVVFNFGAGDHHVTLFEKDNGDGTYNCHGGNQSHKLHVTKFPKSSVMGIRRPSAAGVQPQVAAGTLAPGAEGRAVTALQAALASHGFDPGGIDGEYGPLTSAAVSNFQRASNLPVTGMADLATLQKLGVSADTDRPSSDTPSEQTMPQDILKVLIDALVLKQTGTPAAPATPTTPAPGGVDIGGLLQTVIAALAGKPLPVPAGSDTSGGTATTTPPVLSTIDQIFGGQALAGKKTFLAVIAYVIVAILQAVGEVGPATGAGATATGQILTTIIGAFGVLGGASKLDRLTQALSLIAGKK